MRFLLYVGLYNNCRQSCDPTDSVQRARWAEVYELRWEIFAAHCLSEPDTTVESGSSNQGAFRWVVEVPTQDGFAMFRARTHVHVTYARRLFDS